MLLFSNVVLITNIIIKKNGFLYKNVVKIILLSTLVYLIIIFVG